MRQVVAVGALAVLFLAGCGRWDDPGPALPAEFTTPQTATPVPYVAVELTQANTADPFHLPSGNRLVTGSGSIADDATSTCDATLDGVAVWVTGAYTAAGDVWAVAMSDGSVAGYLVEPSEADSATPGDGPACTLTRITLPDGRLAPGQPPVLAVQDEDVRLADWPASASSQSIPVVLEGQRIAYADNVRRLVVLEPDGTLWHTGVTVTPAARLVQVDETKLLVLADPNNRRPSTALGFPESATSVELVDVAQRSVTRLVDVDPEAIETIAPLLTDLNGDGTSEVLVTVTGPQGTRILAVSLDGSLTAQSDTLEQLSDWRHLVAVGPFGTDGSISIGEVRAPHSDGAVGFLRLSSGRLESVGERSNSVMIPIDIARDANRRPATPSTPCNVDQALTGANREGLSVSEERGSYRSHEISSPNLEQALAADANGDGVAELIIPYQVELLGQRSEADGSSVSVIVPCHTDVVGVQNTPEGVLEIWRRPLSGVLATNIAALQRPDGTFSLAAATREGSLRIWP